jgi:hypothetical protein
VSLLCVSYKEHSFEKTFFETKNQQNKSMDINYIKDEICVPKR